MLILTLTSYISLIGQNSFADARENSSSKYLQLEQQITAKLERAPHTDEHFIAKIGKGSAADIEIKKSLNSRQIIDFGEDSYYAIIPHEGEALSSEMATYALQPGVLDVEPDYQYELDWSLPSGGKTYPSDFNTSNHWFWERINMPRVWFNQDCYPLGADPCGGDSEVVVAIIDNGLGFEDYEAKYKNQSNVLLDITYGASSDMEEANIWVNEEEIPGNGIDDDANGICDDVNGVDFGQFVANNSNGVGVLWNSNCTNADPYIEGSMRKEGHPNSDNGHGHFIASMLVSETDNSLSNAVGMASKVTIMPLKANQPLVQTTLSTTAISLSLRYAADHGADIVNMSFGSPSQSSIITSAVDYAHSAGVVMVASTGNEGIAQISYPAKYPKVISVGSSTQTNVRSSFSNYGNEMELVAPSNNNLNNRNYAESLSCYFSTCTSTSNFTAYTDSYSQGTSFSAPQVAGAAALMKSRNPDYGLEEIRTTMNANAQDIMTPDWDVQTGFGILDVDASLNSMFNFFTAAEGSTNTPLKTVQYNGRIYQFKGGAPAPFPIMYRSSDDGEFDTDCAMIPNDIECFRTPTIGGNTQTEVGVSVFNGDLYVSVRGSLSGEVFTARMSETEGEETWDSSYGTGGWSKSGGQTGSAIELEAYDPDGGGAQPNRLYQVIKGFSTNRIFVRYTTDGLFNDSAPSEIWYVARNSGSDALMQGGASLEVFNNRLYMVVRGASGNIFTSSSADGVWDSSDSGEAYLNHGGLTSTSPNMVSYNNKLYQFVKGNSTQTVFIRFTTDTNPNNGVDWLDWYKAGGITNHRVDSVEFNGRLYNFIRTVSDGIEWRTDLPI